MVEPKIQPVVMTVQAQDLMVGDVIYDPRIPYMTNTVHELYTEEGLSGIPLVHVWDEFYTVTMLFGQRQLVEIARMQGP